jgi:hypothetical protein
MKNKCDYCSLEYDEIYGTVVNYDFAIPGHGKLEHYHLCLNFRKELINWFDK